MRKYPAHDLRPGVGEPKPGAFAEGWWNFRAPEHEGYQYQPARIYNLDFRPSGLIYTSVMVASIR